MSQVDHPPNLDNSNPNGNSDTLNNSSSDNDAAPSIDAVNNERVERNVGTSEGLAEEQGLNATECVKQNPNTQGKRNRRPTPLWTDTTQSSKDKGQQSNQKLCKFQDAWLEPVDPQEQEKRWPRWREWLSRAPSNPNAAYCLLCEKEILLYNIGRGMINYHVQRNKKHEKMLSKKNVPPVSDGEAVRSNSLINAAIGRKRGSSVLEKNAPSQSKRDRPVSKSGSSTSKTLRDLPAPQAQSGSRQGRLSPVSDVSVVLERLPSVQRLNASKASVRATAGNPALQRDSSTTISFERINQSNRSHSSTHFENSTNAHPRVPRVESVFSIDREENDAMDVHHQCNEKHRATESQLDEIKDKYISALETNGQQSNQIRQLELQIAALSQELEVSRARNQDLEARLAAASTDFEIMDIKEDIAE